MPVSGLMFVGGGENPASGDANSAAGLMIQDCCRFPSPDTHKI
jgi:hypothetical protein